MNYETCIIYHQLNSLAILTHNINDHRKEDVRQQFKLAEMGRVTRLLMRILNLTDGFSSKPSETNVKPLRWMQVTHVTRTLRFMHLCVDTAVHKVTTSLPVWSRIIRSD